MVAQKKAKVVEDETWVKKHQKDLSFDEYDLRPDELTKEQFAKKAGVSLRAVEIWKKQGEIAAQKLRRRVDGVVRSQLIFKTADVESFLNDSNEPVNLPKVEKFEPMKTNALQKTNQTEMSDSSQLFAFGNFMQGLLQNAEISRNEPPFLNIKEAAEFSHLSESCLRQLVADEVLTKYTGKHGETMISRKQLLNL